MNKQAGLTLIEVIVVTAIAVMIILGATSLFLTFIVGSGRTTLQLRLRNAGTNALDKMEYHIRNAGNIEGSCTTNLSSLEIKSLNQTKTKFQTDSNRIASVSTSLDPNVTYYLTSDDLTISNLNFDCYQNNNVQYVEISFDLATENGGEGASTSLSSGILLRNTGF